MSARSTRRCGVREVARFIRHLCFALVLVHLAPPATAAVEVVDGDDRASGEDRRGVLPPRLWAT